MKHSRWKKKDAPTKKTDVHITVLKLLYCKYVLPRIFRYFANADKPQQYLNKFNRDERYKVVNVTGTQPYRKIQYKMHFASTPLQAAP